MKLEDEEMLQKIFFSWKGCLDANRIFMIFFVARIIFQRNFTFLLLKLPSKCSCTKLHYISVNCCFVHRDNWDESISTFHLDPSRKRNKTWTLMLVFSVVIRENYSVRGFFGGTLKVRRFLDPQRLWPDVKTRFVKMDLTKCRQIKIFNRGNIFFHTILNFKWNRSSINFTFLS